MSVSITTEIPSCRALSISSFLPSPSLLAVSLPLAGEGIRVGRSHLGPNMSHQNNMGCFLWCMIDHCNVNLPPLCMEGTGLLHHSFKENLWETDTWFEWSTQKKCTGCQNSPVKPPCYITPGYMCRAKCCLSSAEGPVMLWRHHQCHATLGEATSTAMSPGNT